MIKTKENKAITLIALVVTIIILLILAGVTVGFAINGTGLFDKAKQAKEIYSNAQIQEELDIANMNNKIDKIAVVSDRTNTPQNAENTMSSSEHFTGEYYLNYKPIYSKTITVSLPSNSSNTGYQHNIENVDTIWIDNTNSFIDWNNGETSPFPTMNANNLSVVAAITDVSRTTVYIKTDTNRSSYSAYITLRYTKTTD